MALAGYTNVGKSTLLNALTGSEVSVENRLFETLDPTTRGFEHDGKRYLVTDTVGFIRKLPTQLVEGFASTLEETLVADLVLHVVDASESDDRLEEMIASVDTVLGEIGADEVPLELVLNKIDQVDPLGRRRLGERVSRARCRSRRSPARVSMQLRARIAERFADRYEDVRLLLPYEEGAKLAELYALGAPIDEREDGEEGVFIRARLPRREVRRFARYLVADAHEGSAVEPRVARRVWPPDGCRRCRAGRSAADARRAFEFAAASSSRSRPASVASCAAYQRTLPSSAPIALRRSSVRVPPSSRIAFIRTFSAVVAGSSPRTSPSRDARDVVAEIRIDGGLA